MEFKLREIFIIVNSKIIKVNLTNTFALSIIFLLNGLIFLSEIISNYLEVD